MSYINNYLLLPHAYESDEDQNAAIAAINLKLEEGRGFQRIDDAYKGWKGMEAEIWASSSGWSPADMLKLVKEAGFTEEVVLLVKEQDLLNWEIVCEEKSRLIEWKAEAEFQSKRAEAAINSLEHMRAEKERLVTVMIDLENQLKNATPQ